MGETNIEHRTPRGRRGQQSKTTEAVLRLGPRIIPCPMLVTGIQSVVGSFHEDLAPFHQRRGQKTEHGADDYLLHECRVHA